jgi:hypothetical protein
MVDTSRRSCSGWRSWSTAWHRSSSREEIAAIEGLAEWARPRLEMADHDFALHRQLIKAFNWRFTLLWRGEQRAVVVHWQDWDFDVEVNYEGDGSELERICYNWATNVSFTIVAIR